MPIAGLGAAQRADAGQRRERAYLRFIVQDKAGVLAELTAAMRDGGVSIESMIQRGGGEDGVLVAMTTHEGPARAVAAALERLEGSPSLVGRPMVMPILD
jgi:homoserine dehydrogenase